MISRRLTAKEKGHVAPLPVVTPKTTPLRTSGESKIVINQKQL